MTERFAVPVTMTGPDAPAPETDQQPDGQEPEESGQPEEAEAQEPEAPERPEWLPSKFKSPAELAAAYHALERKMGQPAPAPKPKAEGDQPQPDDQPDPAPAISRERLSAYYEEYASTGVLSDQTYAELAGMGLDRDLVDAYISGQQAQTQRTTQELYSVVGGEERYQELSQSIQAAIRGGKISREEVEAYNAALERGDMTSARLALRGLAAAVGHGAPGPKPGKRQVNGSRSANAGATPYESQAQIVAAMRDPRYRKDPAYRDEVDRRLAASDR